MASLTALASGCAPAPGQPAASAAPAENLDPTPPDTAASPTQEPTSGASSSSSSSPSETPAPTPSSKPTDARKGKALDAPFEVAGVVLVSKAHRITAKYVPSWATQQWGLKPAALRAFNRLSKDAAAAGRTLVIRSGYRDFATQQAQFEQALQDYDESTARKYYAEAGASEHQTGLALDAWDGVHRGSAFTALPEAKWLGTHAHEYGFIVRYPKGKTSITGYAYESWHLRWVGTTISKEFGPDSDLTLEEWLGLA